MRDGRKGSRAQRSSSARRSSNKRRNPDARRSLEAQRNSKTRRSHRSGSPSARGDLVLVSLVLGVWLLAVFLGSLYFFDWEIGGTAIAEEPGAPVGKAPSIPATSTTARPAPAASAPLTLAAGGDVIGDRKVGEFIDARGGEAALAGVAPLLSRADVAFVNLESPASDQGSPNPEKDVVFRGRPQLVDGLRAAGVDFVSLANNHTLDWGPAALSDTLERLSSAGIGAAGAGENLAAARKPAVVEVNGDHAALLAYSLILPAGFPAGEERAGVNPGRPDQDRLLGDIRSAAETYEWVIVSVHWGVEYEPAANADQRALAHRMVEAGADVVLGHHPHVIQGLEIYRDSLIAYSLGDFVFDHYSRETGEAFVLEATLREGQPPTLKITPVYLTDDHGIPAVVTDEAADRILTRLATLSSPFGLELERQGDLLVYSP